MATSTDPLTDIELARLLQLIRDDDDAHVPDRFDRRAFLFLLYTGMHPSVLSDPARHALQIDGTSFLMWRRPKTRRRMHNPILPEIRPWVAEFLGSLPPTSHRQYYGRLVRRVARSCGVDGCTARTLRHTYGKLVYRKTHDVNETARLVGCTPQQAMDYARTVEQPADRDLLDSGFSAAPPR